VSSRAATLSKNVIAALHPKTAGVPEAYSPSSCARRNWDGENQRTTEYVVISEAKKMTDGGAEIICSWPGEAIGRRRRSEDRGDVRT
jgi:hypothetical protein